MLTFQLQITLSLTLTFGDNDPFTDFHLANNVVKFWLFSETETNHDTLCYENVALPLG